MFDNEENGQENHGASMLSAILLLGPKVWGDLSLQTGKDDPDSELSEKGQVAEHEVWSHLC